LKRLEKTEWIEPEKRDERRPVMRIPKAPRGGSLSFSLRQAGIGFPGVPLIRDLDLTVYRGERIGILGGNGSGKSTLVKTISGLLPLLSGRLDWGANNIVSHFAQEAEFDSPEMTVKDWIGSLNPSWDLYDIHSFAALFHFRQQDTDKKVGFLSGGEQSRLRFARLFSSPANVMLLDEPTNHLDIESREALEESLQGYAGTLVTVSHDIYFIKRVADRFFIIRNSRLEEIENLEGLAELLEDNSSRESRNGGGGSDWKAREGLSKNQIARLEKQIGEIEAKIEALEEEKLELNSLMQQGIDDHRKLAEMGTRFDQVDRELEELMDEWEQTHRKLE